MLEGLSARRRIIVFTGGAIVLVAAGALAAVLATSGGSGFAQVADRKAEAQKPDDQAQQIGSMTLERQFQGPLKDTVIQRWRDPKDGTICYVYLPVIVQHSPPMQNGMVQYGANHIGSISCFPGK